MRGAARRSARRPSGPPSASGRTRSRGAAARGRSSSRTRPRPPRSARAPSSPAIHSSRPARRWRPSPSVVVDRRDSSTRSTLAGAEQRGPGLLVGVAGGPLRAHRGERHAGAVVQPRAERARQRDPRPVRLAPRVTALTQPVDPLLAAAGAAHGALHAAELLVALHAARAGGGLVARELGRAADRLEGQREAGGAVLVARIQLDAPALERRLDRRAQTGEGEVGEVRAGVELDAAAAERRQRPAAREQHGQRAAEPAVVALRVGREARAREPVEVGVLVAERERHGVRERGGRARACPRAFQLGVDHGWSRSWSTSVAVPSTS